MIHMKLATKCALDGKKKKQQHSYTHLDSWQKVMVQLPFRASCLSVQFSATSRSWILLGHKWCACQPVTAWILGVLNSATFSMSENSKDFLRQIKVKAFENSFEQRFNEIWINLLNWANCSSGLCDKQTPQPKFPWRKWQGNYNQVWHLSTQCLIFKGQNTCHHAIATNTISILTRM